MKTITKGVKVGIYENCEYVARIYPDRIVLTSPYVRWVGNTGGYAERKERIDNPVVVVAHVIGLLIEALAKDERYEPHAQAERLSQAIEAYLAARKRRAKR